MDYSEIRSRQQALSSAFETGTLTEAMLDREVMNVVEDPGDGPSRSIGYEWIVENVEAFARTVPNAGTFLRRHLEVWRFTDLVVLHPELLRLLPEAEREPYVRASIMRHGAWNTSWVRAALAVGISRGQLAEIILAKLETAVYHRTSVNYVYSFMRYGAGDVTRERFEQDAEWSVLTDEQFVEALRICARKAPSEVLREPGKINLRLGKERAQELFIAVADDLCHLICPEVIETLPFETRLALARRLAIPSDMHRSEQGAATLRFIIRLMRELEKQGKAQQALDLFIEKKSIFDGCHAPTLYRAAHPVAFDAWRALKRSNQPGVADCVIEWLEATLKNDGYALGEVERGSYVRKGRTVLQWQVRIGSLTYVQDRNQHRYFPKAGDRVLFKPASGYRLTSQVVSVAFVPINGQEY